MKRLFLAAFVVGLIAVGIQASAQSETQLKRWLKRFPQADANRDGKLTAKEARTFRKRFLSDLPGRAPRTFPIDPRWDEDQFPDHAVCYLSPAEIKRLNRGNATSFPKPENGVKRIVATGHSFMTPGFGTLPRICRAAGFEQPLHVHVGGAMKGSARYKWEEENGIFQFNGRPKPVLLSAIANAEWEAMIWGPYYQDRAEFFACWIDFCLKYNPDMKFYLSDAWPQLDQLDHLPLSEAELDSETITRLGKEKHAKTAEIIRELNESYQDRVYVLPTCDALVLAAQYYHSGMLPGIQGVNRAIGNKPLSIWRDPLGHLGPGFERLEGYVFYGTLYQRSPELIEDPIKFQRKGDTPFPNKALDDTFREIAWQAIINNPLSGVRDENGDGIGD